MKTHIYIDRYTRTNRTIDRSDKPTSQGRLKVDIQFDWSLNIVSRCSCDGGRWTNTQQPKGTEKARVGEELERE